MKNWVTRVVAVRVAAVASEVWMRAAKLAVQSDAPWVPAPLSLPQRVVEPAGDSDPLDEIDQTEIVSIVRRWEGDQGFVYVDFGEMDPDVALALMLRGMFGVLLADVLPVDADGDE